MQTAKTRTIRYATPELFLALNARCLAEERNRACNPEVMAAIAPETKLPVTFTLLTGPDDRYVRSQFVLNRDGETAWLDLTVDEFNRLPTVEVEKENSDV